MLNKFLGVDVYQLSLELINLWRDMVETNFMLETKVDKQKKKYEVTGNTKPLPGYR